MSTPSKRQATMDALNSAMGDMTLTGGAVRASPDLHMFVIRHGMKCRYKYKRMDSTTDADYEQWRKRNPITTTIKPSSSLHISRCNKNLENEIIDSTTLVSTL